MTNTANNMASRWFVFYKDQLLLQKQDGGFTIPFQINPPIPTDENIKIHEITCMGDVPCRAYSIETPMEENEEYIMVGLRESYEYISHELHKVAGKASQIIYWDKYSQYCPACGVKTVQTTPITKVCPKCQKEIYPFIHPAVLVLIRKGDSILLVHARNFRGNFHGLVAGFLETGETLEECVEREVMEETGLSIKNITYFGNQPWPYPSQLMIGFIADYASGEIKLQDEELSSGAFFTKDNLPEIPRKLSLARKMIDWWLTKQQPI